MAYLAVYVYFFFVSFLLLVVLLLGPPIHVLSRNVLFEGKAVHCPHLDQDLKEDMALPEPVQWQQQ